VAPGECPVSDVRSSVRPATPSEIDPSTFTSFTSSGEMGVEVFFCPAAMAPSGFRSTSSRKDRKEAPHEWGYE
jgi:hypothetical protein